MELLQKVSLCGSIGLASRLACKDQQRVQEENIINGLWLFTGRFFAFLPTLEKMATAAC